MSTQDSDGVEDAIQGVTQVAMTTAARMGEELARAREKRAREAQASSEQAAREVAGRFTAEREAARAALAPVHRPQWWNDAQSEDMSKAYQTATAWKDIDPDAARAEQRIVEEVHTRFGVDLNRDGDPRGLADALAREERARATAQDERGAARGETAQAVGLMARADAADRFAVQQDGPLDERIAATSARLTWLEGGARNSLPRTHPDRNEGTVRAANDELRTLLKERDALAPQHDPHQEPESQGNGPDAADRPAAAAADPGSENEAWHDTDDPFFMESNPFSEPADFYDDGQAAGSRPAAEPAARAGAELRKDGHAAYDSAERRQDLAASLDHIGNSAAAEARVRADVAQGRPATDATASKLGKAPKARKTRGSGQTARTAQRTGRSR